MVFSVRVTVQGPLAFGRDVDRFIEFHLAAEQLREQRVLVREGVVLILLEVHRFAGVHDKGRSHRERVPPDAFAEVVGLLEAGDFRLAENVLDREQGVAREQAGRGHGDRRVRGIAEMAHELCLIVRVGGGVMGNAVVGIGIGVVEVGREVLIGPLTVVSLRDAVEAVVGRLDRLDLLRAVRVVVLIPPDLREADAAVDERTADEQFEADRTGERDGKRPFRGLFRERRVFPVLHREEFRQREGEEQ